MAQHDYDIADQSGLSFLSDLNNLASAVVSNNSGATEPATKFAYQFWADTTSGLLKQRNSANSAWITIGTMATANLGLALLSGSAFTGSVTSTAGDVNLKTNTALSDAAATLTAAQLIGGEFTITPTVARIQTTDTAANIIAALTGSVTNSNFAFTIVNNAAFDVTVAAGAGVTLVGSAVINNGSATWRVRVTSGTTVSVIRLDGSADADTLDGLDSTVFLRNDNTGNKVVEGNPYIAEDTVTFTGGGNSTWTIANGAEAVLTLTASTSTLAVAAVPPAGTYATIRIVQGGAGSFTLALSADFDVGATGAPALSTAVGAEDILNFRSNGTKLHLVGSSLGFA